MSKNEKRFKAGLLVALCGGLYAFQLFRITPVALTLEEAIAQKKVACKFTSNGNYSGESVAISLTNLTGTPLQVRITPGTVFKPSEDEDQDLIVVQEQAIALNAKATSQQVLDGYCMESHDGVPTENNSMKLTRTSNPKLLELAAYLNNKGYDDGTIQDAVWAVTDASPVSTIPNSSEEEKNLRSFTSELTDQPNPWYTTGQERVVTPERRIESNPVSVNGMISFQSDGKVKIHEVVQRVGGEVMDTSEPIEFPQKGKWNYEFTLTVKGWEKGDYVVNVMDGTKLVKAFPFTI